MGDYLLILIIQENRGEINREYYGGIASVCLTARICLMETLHKARLTALHAICLQIFRHIAQKSLAIHQVCLRNFCAICRKI